MTISDTHLAQAGQHADRKHLDETDEGSRAVGSRP